MRRLAFALVLLVGVAGCASDVGVAAQVGEKTIKVSQVQSSVNSVIALRNELKSEADPNISDLSRGQLRFHMLSVLIDEVAALLKIVATPAEVDARIRIALGKHAIELVASDPHAGEIRTGEVTIDESTYTARLKGNVLDLTFKEFELLKYLAQHPGRVFTRAQLLQEIWGYDYFGGTRTVDVHIRRLRAKLGPEHEALIGTVRHVGYRFNTPNSQNQGAPALSDH